MRVVRAVLVAGTFAYLLLPTIFVFPLALAGADVLAFPPPGGLSLRHFVALADTPIWRDAFLTSFQVAGLAVLFATTVGTAAAVVLPPSPRILRIPLELTIVAPLVIPPIVFAVAWFSLFGTFDMLGSLPAVAIAHGILGLPLVYLNVSVGLSSFDHRLVLAARSLGASPWSVFRTVVAPLLAPSIVAGAALTFVLSFDELIVALFLGGGLVATVPVRMWNQISYNESPEIAAAAAVSVILTLGGVAIAVAALRLRTRKRVSAT